MKKKFIIPFLLIGSVFASCIDNELDEYPMDENFPYRLVLDAEEGGDLADAEDYGLEIAFADFLGDLPEGTVTVDYEISDLEDDMVGAVEIDEITYEDEDENEYTLDFTKSADGLTGTITLNVADLGSVLPEAFEVVFKLPGEEEIFYAEGSFKFSLSNLQAHGANIVLGTPNEFEYEVLDHELAGSWKFEIEDEDELDAFKEVFAPISPDLDELEFSDVKVDEPIEVEMEFEYEEINIKIIYINTDDEEVEIEIEGEYDFDEEEFELEVEGSHFIIGDDGEIEDELDFIIEAEYSINGDVLTVSISKVIDEDDFAEGEELYAGDANFEFEKD